MFDLMLLLKIPTVIKQAQASFKNIYHKKSALLTSGADI